MGRGCSRGADDPGSGRGEWSVTPGRTDGGMTDWSAVASVADSGSTMARHRRKAVGRGLNDEGGLSGRRVHTCESVPGNKTKTHGEGGQGGAGQGDAGIQLGSLPQEIGLDQRNG